MHLVVAQYDLLGLAGQFHLEHGRVEGFLLQREEQRVVIELDHGGGGVTVEVSLFHISGSRRGGWL